MCKSIFFQRGWLRITKDSNTQGDATNGTYILVTYSTYLLSTVKLYVLNTPSLKGKDSLLS